jgi:hypothetical protein
LRHILDRVHQILYSAGIWRRHRVKEGFMAAKRKFKCETCGKVKEVGAKARVPECCRKPMQAAA